MTPPRDRRARTGGPTRLEEPTPPRDERGGTESRETWERETEAPVLTTSAMIARDLHHSQLGLVHTPPAHERRALLQARRDEDDEDDPYWSRLLRRLGLDDDND